MGRLRRHSGLFLGGTLLVLLVVTAFVIRGDRLLADAHIARAELALAADSIQQRGFGINRAEVNVTVEHLARADRHLARLEAALADPALAVARLIPAVDGQLDAATELLRASRLLTSRHQVIASLMVGFVDARDRGEGAERIADLVRELADARASITELMNAATESDRILGALEPDQLIGPLGRLHATMDLHLARLGPGMASIQMTVDLLPAVMGVGGEKRYLVFALDNAEIRPAGGLLAAFATPSFTDGLMTDFSFRDILEIDRPRQDPYVPPPDALRNHLLGNFSWQVADAGWWPEFELSAGEARRLYAIETGDDDIDGVLAFTPGVVDALLEIVGPVAIPEAGITVHPGETYLVSLEQVEVLNRGADRKRFLAQLASTVVERLYALPADRFLEVAAALDRAGKRRQIQVFLDDPQAQAWMTDLGWYTPFAFPDEGDRLAIMEANVAPVSKLNVLVHLDHELDVTLDADGNAQERLTTTYTNRFGPALPAKLRAVDLAFRFGNLGTYQRRYLVPNARDVSVASNGIPPLTSPERVEPELGSLAIANYHLVRPGVTRLETSYVAPQVVVSASDPAVEGTYRLHFFKQAGRDGDTLRVSVTVPPGTRPVGWSEDGTVRGGTVSFSTTTEFDRFFEVHYSSK